MPDHVDVRELAIERSSAGVPGPGARRHVVARYVLPLSLLTGFAALAAWSSWELLFPPRAVSVVPVHVAVSSARPAGTVLFTAAGWIEPRPTPVRAAALAPGVVERLLVVEDQEVRQGDAVAELVRQDAQLALQRAAADQRLREAELAEARATFRAADARFRQPVHLRAALSESEAALARVETQWANLPFERRRAAAEAAAARRDYQGKLSAGDVVPGVQLSHAQARLESADSLVQELASRAAPLDQERRALEQRRDALRTQLELLIGETQAKHEAEAKLAAASARVAQAELAVAEARLQLDRMTIRAPIAGRVYRLIAHPGARVGGGYTHTASDGSTVVTMYDPQLLQVRVDVRFEDLPKVQLRQQVVVSNPALAAPVAGRVLFISSEADIQKNTLQVKVELPEVVPVFRPEMLTEVAFLAAAPPERSATEAQPLRLFVDARLIQHDAGGAVVWVADQSEGRARQVRVDTVAAAAGDLVEVTRGLTMTSRIIASDTAGLNDGDRIVVTGEAPALEAASPGGRNGGQDADDSSGARDSHPGVAPANSRQRFPDKGISHGAH